MAKKFTYKTQGTCSKSIEIELEGDIVKSVRFEGGCHGNTQGIGLLTRGMQAADVIARLEGIDCKGRGTSCPDQLAKALASGPRTITATTKPENGPVLQNPGKQRKNKSSYTVSRTAPGNGAADVCRSPGPAEAKAETFSEKYDDPTARPTTSFESGNPMRKGCANKNKDDYILYYQAFETSDPTRLFAACAMHENKKAGF